MDYFPEITAGMEGLELSSLGTGSAGGFGGWGQVGQAIGGGVSNTGQALSQIPTQAQGMNPRMREIYEVLGIANAPQMLANQIWDVDKSRKRADDLWAQMQAGTMPAAIQQAIGKAKQWGNYSFEQVGPAATQTALEQQLAGDYASMARQFAGAGVGQNQMNQMRQQLADKVTQQGYAAQQQGTQQFAQIMAQLEPALIQSGWQMNEQQRQYETNNANQLRESFLGGASGAVGPVSQTPQILGAIASGFPCCFIMLEARYSDGTMDEVARRYRDEHMTERNRRGYYKLATVLVPLMRKSRVAKWLVKKLMADPLIGYGNYYYGKNKWGKLLAPVKNFWMKAFDVIGTDTPFLRENGEYV